MKEPVDVLRHIEDRLVVLNRALDEARNFLEYSRDEHAIDLRQSFGITLRRIQAKKSELKHLKEFINA